MPTIPAVAPDFSPGFDTGITSPSYRHFTPELLVSALQDQEEWRIKEFVTSWEDLPVDAYLADGATFRRRRYSRFRFTENGRLVPSGPVAFEQSTEVNSLFGGVQRHFEPMHDDVAGSPVLEAIVKSFLRVLPGEFDARSGGVGVHQIRIVASRDEAWPPAPEGVHEDGHHFVAQVLVNRDGVTGGESQIYDRDKLPIFRTLLTDRFEAVVIDDRRVFHGVSAVSPAAGVTVGVRDMMLIDFFPLTDQ